MTNLQQKYFRTVCGIANRWTQSFTFHN